MIGRGFFGGLVVGLLLGASVTGVVGFTMMQRDVQQVRAGWALKPAVVLTRDVPAGTVLSYELLAQRATPAQIVTETLVGPGAVKAVINHPLQVALHKGDLLRWSDVEGAERPPQRE